MAKGLFYWVSALGESLHLPKFATMIKSMTGYGKSEGTVGNRKYTVEMRALNSKQLDLNLRMPSVFKEGEMALRNRLSRKLIRGKIDITI